VLWHAAVRKERHALLLLLEPLHRRDLKATVRSEFMALWRFLGVSLGPRLGLDESTEAMAEQWLHQQTVSSQGDPSAWC
jgi:hypothetical protein